MDKILKKIKNKELKPDFNKFYDQCSIDIYDNDSDDSVFIRFNDNEINFTHSNNTKKTKMRIDLNKQILFFDNDEIYISNNKTKKIKDLMFKLKNHYVQI